MGSDHSAAEGARRDAHKKERLFRVLWVYSLSKPTGNVASRQSIIGAVLGVNVILTRKQLNNYCFSLDYNSICKEHCLIILTKNNALYSHIYLLFYLSDIFIILE